MRDKVYSLKDESKLPYKLDNNSFLMEFDKTTEIVGVDEDEVICKDIEDNAIYKIPYQDLDEEDLKRLSRNF